jgi:hypothetical protein
VLLALLPLSPRPRVGTLCPQAGALPQHHAAVWSHEGRQPSSPSNINTFAERHHAVATHFVWWTRRSDRRQMRSKTTYVPKKLQLLRRTCSSGSAFAVTLLQICLVHAPAECCECAYCSFCYSPPPFKSGQLRARHRCVLALRHHATPNRQSTHRSFPTWLI